MAESSSKGKGKATDSIEDSSLTYNETIDVIVQFLEAAFHTVLYIRNVYPSEIFKAHRLYSVPVFRSRHPGLNEYITGILAAIREELVQSRLKNVALVISSATSGEPLERYMFEFEFLLSHIRGGDRDLSIRDNLSFKEISLCFRGFLMKLGVLDAALEDIGGLKDDLTFAVLLEMKDGQRPGPQGTDPHQPDEGPWVPADVRRPEQHVQTSSNEQMPRAQRSTAAEGDQFDSDSLVLPVKSLDSGVINLALYVEDNPSRKAALRGGNRATKQLTSRAIAEDQLRRMQLRLDENDARSTTEAAETAASDMQNAARRDAQGRRSAGRRTKRKALDSTVGGPPTAEADDESSEDQVPGAHGRPSSRSDSSSGKSHSDDAASEDSIKSVGDFAGYGGAGAGAGGGGMTAGW